MNISKTYIEEKEIELIQKLKNSDQSVEAYIKAASFLHFSERYNTAIDILNLGLLKYPLNEKIIRAKFSFLSSSFNLLAALEFASSYDDIFDDDADSLLVQACDLIRINLTLSPPTHLNQPQIMRLTNELQLISESNQVSLKTIITDLIDDYKLPLVGLGIAKFYADKGDDYAQNLLGSCYLNATYVARDSERAMHYLTLARDNHNELAIKRINLFYSTTN